jgi:hypothetical protein
VHSQPERDSEEPYPGIDTFLPFLENSELRRLETDAISVYDQSRFSAMTQLDLPVFGPLDRPS